MANYDGLGTFDELFIAPKTEVKNKSAQPKSKAGEKEKQDDGIKHDHPACATDHVHEKAFVTSSAGGEITEGCAEHYFDRIVSTGQIANTVKTHGKLAEYIIMGEILLNPKFKRRGRI